MNTNYNHNETTGFGKFDFVGKINLFGGLSALFVIVSILYLSIRGISYGIDFSGGTEVQIKFNEGTVTEDSIKQAVSSLNLIALHSQSLDKNEFILRFQTKQGATEKESNDILNQTVTQFREKITATFAAQNPEFRRIDSVGPQVGADLKKSGVLAVFYSLLVILIYVGLRFDYKYAPGAVICLFHDAIITLAIFVFVGKEVNIPIMAAILTLIGFSLNDTIVVFDRIRETEEEHSKKGTKFIINKAINDMLMRTLITSGTVFISSVSLWIFADGTVADIAFAICVGIIFGTYSSIYVAAPTIMIMEKFKAKNSQIKQPATT